MPDRGRWCWKMAMEVRQECPRWPLPGSQSVTFSIWSQSFNSWQLPETPQPISCIPAASLKHINTFFCLFFFFNCGSHPYWFHLNSASLVFCKYLIASRVLTNKDKIKPRNLKLFTSVRWFLHLIITPHPTTMHLFFICWYLESPHVPWVSCCLQTILVAFQEKLQEEPAEVNIRTRVCRTTTSKK